MFVCLSIRVVERLRLLALFPGILYVLEVFIMYQIITNKDCQEGYCFVRDFLGNLIFYGTGKQCLEFIRVMEGRTK